MQRLWFRVWQQGQPLDFPVLVEDLPRQAHISGHIASRRGRDCALAEVYILAASAEEALEGFSEAYARLSAE